MSVAVKDKLATLEEIKYILDNYVSSNSTKYIELNSVSTYSALLDLLAPISVGEAFTVAITATTANTLFSTVLQNHAYYGLVLRISDDSSTNYQRYTFTVFSTSSSVNAVRFQVGLSPTTPDTSPSIILIEKYYGGADEAAVRTALSVPATLNLTGSTFAALYPLLNVMPTNTTYTWYALDAVTKILTGSKVSGLKGGAVYRANATVFEFMCWGANDQYMYKWRVTFASDGSSATVGTVYRFAGTAI